MPTVALAQDRLTAVAADVLAVFAFKEEQDGRARAVPGVDAAAVAEHAGVDLHDVLDALRFEADLGAVARVPVGGRLGAPLLVVVGLGRRDRADVDALRKAAGAAARSAQKDARLAIVVPGDLRERTTAEALAQAVVEGAALGAYAFTEYRTKHHDKPSLEAIAVVAGEGVTGELARAVQVGNAMARATTLARDLVNTPPAAKRPPALAERFVEVAQQAGLEVRVHDEAALREGGFGGILGVGQGSSVPPRLVEITYDPQPADGHVVLVGKGITFDSGGLSLKPSESMKTMKCDMSGAATVLAVMTLLREFDVGRKVTALAALAENMPSGDAIRVSDVLRHYGGKTVEVMNTDAEGRLVLGDAIAYAAQWQPDAIIDVATLTGAQIVALGPKVAALMGTEDELLARLESAAAAAGEPVWRLPLVDDYAEHLKSEVADLKNVGKPGQAGTIIGGLYLKEFTAGLPWAHLDIAGPAFTDEGDKFFTAKGGTGFGVRTLAEFLRA